MIPPFVYYSLCLNLKLRFYILQQFICYHSLRFISLPSLILIVHSLMTSMREHYVLRVSNASRLQRDININRMDWSNSDLDFHWFIAELSCHVSLEGNSRYFTYLYILIDIWFCIFLLFGLLAEQHLTPVPTSSMDKTDERRATRAASTRWSYPSMEAY